MPRPACRTAVGEADTRARLSAGRGAVSRAAGFAFERAHASPAAHAQDDVLRRAVALHNGKNWKKIGASKAQAPSFGLQSLRWGTRLSVLRRHSPGAR